MLRKSPTLAKSARMGHPTSKAKRLQRQEVPQAPNYKAAAMAAEACGKKRLDIFPYGNVLLRHGEGGDHIGCI
jgi:hypothetical protein